ncbi:hypothetical protein OKW21_000475 [Catalinimonas alkaloidigena]|uniref:sulfotransferase n=1 Tax=Catalinimonas alkaloidigena TaxID=1075417 RepID=UPI002406E24D|nr:sulfotransferase [Catalinimonas alkaloidigena]MDF9795212.1 hypothetical protein [Catalinimonas alkaloidigena]
MIEKALFFNFFQKKLTFLLHTIYTLLGRNQKISILLYASRRGGSTLLAQSIAAKRSISIIDQPFDLWKPDTERGKIITSHIPAKAMSQFFELSPVEKSQVNHYLNSIYQRKLNQLADRPNSSQFVLKIVNAHGLIDELSDMVPSRSVALIRHPCAQASSVVRNKWGTCEEPFLYSTDWAKKYLSPAQLAFGLKISKEGSYFSKAVLNWCLEWQYPLKYAASEYYLIRYEDLIISPEPTIKKLFNFLHLNHVEEAISVLKKPSNSSSFSTEATLEDIEKGTKENLLSNWRKYLSDEAIIEAQQILDIFEIELYHTKHNLPQ